MMSPKTVPTVCIPQELETRESRSSGYSAEDAKTRVGSNAHFICRHAHEQGWFPDDNVDFIRMETAMLKPRARSPFSPNAHVSTSALRHELPDSFMDCKLENY